MNRIERKNGKETERSICNGLNEKVDGTGRRKRNRTGYARD